MLGFGLGVRLGDVLGCLLTKMGHIYNDDLKVNWLF